MTNQNFSRPGAVDLSTLSAAGTAGRPAGGSYVQEVDEASLDAVVRKSVQHPVVLELYSTRAQGARELSEALSQAADADAGKWLLARVDVDAQPRIGQALGIQAVPTVIALIGGQAMPLFQGTRSAAEVRGYIDQVVKTAVANGIVGRAEPVRAASNGPTGSDEPDADPRFEAADEALQRGDYVAAVAEFEKLLAQTPGDAEVIAGRAQASLLVRTTRLDPVAVQVRSVQLDDVAAQLDAADLEILRADPAAAFTRLIELIKRTRDADRELARVRLLELFEVIGRSEPSVLKARRALTTALF